MVKDEGWKAGHRPPQCCSRKHEIQGRALALILSLGLASLPRQSPLSKTWNMVSMSRSPCSICLRKELEV